MSTEQMVSTAACPSDFQLWMNQPMHKFLISDELFGGQQFRNEQHTNGFHVFTVWRRLERGENGGGYDLFLNSETYLDN